jgi:membrane-bound metal-dependent hydrolase YbcI (DUF457 family)
MQLGHLPLALSIATYDWNPKTVALTVGMHWLPNADSLVVKAGWAKPEFHCTVTHSFLFAFVVSALVYLWSPHYATFTFIAIVAHYLADIGSTVGLPLFWPASGKRLTLALFKDTGYWGWDMYIGYYKQPMAWVLEGAVTAFFIWRLFEIGVL